MLSLLVEEGKKQEICSHAQLGPDNVKVLKVVQVVLNTLAVVDR